MLMLLWWGQRWRPAGAARMWWWNSEMHRYFCKDMRHIWMLGCMHGECNIVHIWNCAEKRLLLLWAALTQKCDCHNNGWITLFMIKVVCLLSTHRISEVLPRLAMEFLLRRSDIYSAHIPTLVGALQQNKHFFSTKVRYFFYRPLLLCVHWFFNVYDTMSSLCLCIYVKWFLLPLIVSHVLSFTHLWYSVTDGNQVLVNWGGIMWDMKHWLFYDITGHVNTLCKLITHHHLFLDKILMCYVFSLQATAMSVDCLGRHAVLSGCVIQSHTLHQPVKTLELAVKELEIPHQDTNPSRWYPVRSSAPVNNQSDIPHQKTIVSCHRWGIYTL